MTKEMAVYSAMKSYLEKNTLQYFTFSPNSAPSPRHASGKIFPTALKT
jgi:hypothetical protein